jgi:acyl-coenzyme A synthetase/AMP-(fatty) acid ligase
LSPPSTPLSRLLEKRGDGATTIAFGHAGERRRCDLLRDVSALAARVEEIGTGRWLLCSRDGYAGAVALLALARCRALAVLPPNLQPETLRRLTSTATGALIDSDAAAESLPKGMQALDPLGQVAAEPAAPARLDRDAPLVEFHTSGTTGDARAVRKALRHLEDEVVTLEATLGAQLPAKARIFATASHQHIYGLLFRVLWPLASGRPFQSETLLYAGEILPRMAASAITALVTTPAHLKRMAASGDLRQIRGSCRAVYSSGGPLDSETAKSVADQLGSAPWEIFGSTETGGVAMRRRDVHGEEWEALPGVDIRRREGDGRLEVTSPFVSVGNDLGVEGRATTVMGDRIERTPRGGFLLLGRADRVVKVGEKRLALPQMEQLLEAHPWVDEAALLLLDRAGEGRVHAAVVPSADGRRALASDGSRNFRSALERHLSERYDPVLVPRGWRILEVLPRNAQDKIPVASLRAAFEPSTGERPRAAQILDERRDASSIERRLRVPEDLAQLEGHFDNFPVVPGVVQLGWAMQAAADLLGLNPPLAGLEALKFPLPLRPGSSLTLRVERSDDGRRLRFRLFEGDDVFVTGRALLAVDELGGGTA